MYRLEKEAVGEYDFGQRVQTDAAKKQKIVLVI